MTDLTAFVDGIVHEPTQTEGRGLDLTVTEVYEVTDPGRVDFGVRKSHRDFRSPSEIFDF